MSDEAEQMAAALDNLGIDDEPIVEEVVDEVVEDEVIEDDPPEDPPGFLSHADYLEKHGNDDGWRGKDAYSAEYDRIQDNKKLSGEVRQLTDLVRTTAEATTEMQSQAYQRGVDEAKVELQEALDNNDAQGVVDAQEKINAIPQPKAVPKVTPVHGQFFESNPMLDNQSSQFDGEIMDEFQRIYNGRLQADGVRPDQQLSERAIKGYMEAALKSTKELFSDKFESPKNTRKTNQSSQRRTTQKVSTVDAIKSTKITTKNPRDNDPLMDTYNTILNMKGGGKEAADKFAAKMGIG